MFEFENESKFDTWEQECNHLEKAKDKTLVKTLMDTYSVNFMDLRCIDSSSLKKYDPKYYEFRLHKGNDRFRYDPIKCEWEKMMDHFYSWDEQYKYIEMSKDTEMVESLEKTFGYSFMNDIRSLNNKFEFYLLSERKINLKYEDKTWTKSLYCDRIKAEHIPEFESRDTKIKSISYGKTCYTTYPCQHYIHLEHEDGTVTSNLMGARGICKIFKDNGYLIPEHFKYIENEK